MIKGKKNKKIQITTVLGRGCEINGDFILEGSGRIDGKITGDVTVSGHLILGTGAEITGKVKAHSVVIGGTVCGDVEVAEKTELSVTAKVTGDIVTGELVVDDHAVFQGKCEMNPLVSEKQEKANVKKSLRIGKRNAKEAVSEAVEEMEKEV